MKTHPKTHPTEAVALRGKIRGHSGRLVAGRKVTARRIASLRDVLETDPIALHAAIMDGLAIATLDDFLTTYALTVGEATRVVQIPERTLARRREAGCLDPQESDRLVRAVLMFSHVTRVFNGDTAEARGWLSRPQRVLGGQVPLELAATAIGGQEVERALLRIEHGVFA